VNSPFSRHPVWKPAYRGPFFVETFFQDNSYSPTYAYTAPCYGPPRERIVFGLILSKMIGSVFCLIMVAAGAHVSSPYLPSYCPSFLPFANCPCISCLFSAPTALVLIPASYKSVCRFFCFEARFFRVILSIFTHRFPSPRPSFLFEPFSTPPGMIAGIIALFPFFRKRPFLFFPHFAHSDYGAVLFNILLLKESSLSFLLCFLKVEGLPFGRRVATIATRPAQHLGFPSLCFSSHFTGRLLRT